MFRLNSLLWQTGRTSQLPRICSGRNLHTIMYESTANSVKVSHYKMQCVIRYQPSASIFTNPPVRISTPLDNYSSTPFGAQGSILDKLLNPKEAEQISASGLASGLRHLAQQEYQRLMSFIPWLQSNTNMAYVQLKLKDQLEDVMKPLLEDEQFIAMCELLEKRVDSMTHKESAETFLCLLYLGYDPTSTLIHKLLFKCKADISEYDWHCLSVISLVNKALQRVDPDLNRNITQRHVKLIESMDIGLTQEELYDHCVVVHNTWRFYSLALLVRCANVVESGMKDYGPSSSLSGEEISTLVLVSAIFNSQFRFRKHEQDTTIFDEMRPKLASLVASNMDKFDPIHLRGSKKNLMSMGLFDAHMRQIFDNHVSNFLEEHHNDVQLDVAANLLCVFTRQTDKSLVRQLESVLYKKLMDEVDVITLSHIAQALADINSTNSDLLILVQDHIIQNADALMHYVSRFTKIFRFLISKQFLNPEHKNQLADLIVHCINKGQHGVTNPAMMSRTIAVLIPNTSEPLPKVLMLKLLSAIPKWSQPSLNHLITGLNSLRSQHLNSELRHQITQIYSLLYVTILESKDAIHGFKNLNLLTKGFVIENHQQDPEVTELLMDLHVGHADHVSDDQMIKMMLNCIKTRYFNEELYETFADSVLKQQDPAARAESCKWLTSVLAMAGYEPKKFEELLSVLKETLGALHAEGNIRAWLFMLYQLVILEHFTEEELRKLFTLEMLEKIDTYCEERPHFLKQVENLVSDLNRSCFIETPQLEVPWFSGRFKKHYFETYLHEHPRQTGYRLRSEVERVLKLVVGGSENYSRWTYSPYYHLIEFECILDTNHRVLPWKPCTTSQRSGSQRVAIEVLKEVNYAFNSQRLVGVRNMYRRQLQIIGYHVVQVPYYEWNSMGLADHKAKRDYLRNKIFDF